MTTDDLIKLNIRLGNLAEIKDVIVIRKGATNGDVIKAVFPKANVWESAGRICVDDHGCLKTFSINWWNTLYKAEREKMRNDNNRIN